MSSHSLKFILAALFLAFPVISGLGHHLVPQPGIEYKEAKGTHPRNSDRPTTHTHRLTAHRSGGKNARSVAAILGAVQRRHGGGAYENITSETAWGTIYGIRIGWAGWQADVVLDTGSSDTWVIQQNFTCVGAMGDPVDQAACMFGPAYPGEFEGGPIFDQHMFTQYGDGEMASGPMGFEDITVGNLTVRQQEVCLVNETYWQGDNQTSGIIGFAYPSITNAYYGDGPTDGWIDEVQYSPIFTSMVQQGLVEPCFGMAIERNSSGGVLSLGGPPHIPNVDYRNGAECPILITNLNQNPYAAWEYSFYTIVPDGFVYNQITDTTAVPMIVDSGTTLIYLPGPIAKAINAAFQPAATFLFEYGAYFTSCTAIAPLFAVLIGGKRFELNRRDMIYRGMRDPMTGLCMTAINDGGAGPMILGDAFLQNAVVVFDVGNATMRFFSRPYY